MDGCLQRHLSPQILPHLNQFYKGRLEIQGVPSYHQEAQFHAGKSMRTQAAINKKGKIKTSLCLCGLEHGNKHHSMLQNSKSRN